MAPVVAVAAVAALAVLAAGVLPGCGRGKASTPATLPPGIVGQRYAAALDPANVALAVVVNRALAYSGGSTADMDSAARPAVTKLDGASRQAGAIAAPEPLRRDIHDVVTTLKVVVGDLTALGVAKGDAIEPQIARLVADAGREAAADNLVRLAVIQLTTPTTLPPVTLEPPTLPPTTTPTTVARHTTTTRGRTTTTTSGAHTTTTVAHTTTTVAHTTTTRHLTTTTPTLQH